MNLDCENQQNPTLIVTIFTIARNLRYAQERVLSAFKKSLYLKGILPNF